MLLRMHDRSDYEAATEFLGRTRPYLGPWAACAAGQDGFQLRQPNCAAWIERASTYLMPVGCVNCAGAAVGSACRV